MSLFGNTTPNESDIAHYVLSMSESVKYNSEAYNLLGVLEATVELIDVAKTTEAVSDLLRRARAAIAAYEQVRATR